MQDKNSASLKSGFGPELNTVAVDASVLRRIFRWQVLALIVTGAIALTLLVGFTIVPRALAISLCAFSAFSLSIFPYMTINSASRASAIRPPQKMEYIAVSVGLALAQLIFVLPVIACIMAPAVNFRTMLFG